MHYRQFLLFGLIFLNLGILVARGQTECPNAPVTPIPIPTYTTTAPTITTTPLPIPNNTDCPNLPIPAYTTTPPPTTTTSLPIPNKTDCSNTPIPGYPTTPPTATTTSGPTSSPCSALPTNSPCSSTTNCPILQTNVFQFSVCGNQLIYSCPNYQMSQCCLQPIGQNCATSCSGSGNLNCIPSSTNQPTTEVTRPYEPPTTAIPPEPIMKCPSGTQLIGKECHLIYCPRGSVMLNDRCVVIECPEGTIWIGHRCSVPEPITHNITFYNTVVTKFNQTKPDIILNSTNNIIVNASLAIHDDIIKYNKECNGDCDTENSTTTTASTPPKQDCCVVMTPRMCEKKNNSWRCYSRRSRRCGEFCVAPIIYLKPSQILASSQYIVMPPIQYNCRLYGNCGPVRGEYDCSGCAVNNMEQCSHYCYRYACPSRRCDFYDQEKYCVDNAFSYGCQEEDGCLESWCQ